MLARAASQEKPFDLKPGLRGLESVYIHNECSKGAYFTHKFLPLLDFPAMRVLSTTSFCEDSGWKNAREYPKPAPGTSGITELEFHECNGGNDMADFIVSCANLGLFDYQHTKVVWGDKYYNFSPLILYTPLYTQRHSLRVLRLNNNGDIEIEDDWFSEDDWEVENDMGHSSFGSLVEFHQLRELRMPLQTLLQFDKYSEPAVSLMEVLPTSLEHLQLAGYREDDFEDVIENLQLMLAHQTERFPNLKRIEIQPVVLELDYDTFSNNYMCPKIRDSVTRKFAPLKKDCDQLGLEFGLTKDGIHDVLDPYH